EAAEEPMALAESAPAGSAAPPPPASPRAMAGGGASSGMGMGMGSANGRGMAEKKVAVAGNEEPEAPAPSIAIKPWDPQTPYLAAIKAALKDANGTEAPRRAYAAYLAQRPAHQTSPAFYLDCAELLFRQGRASEGQRAAEPWHGLGVRVLSSIVDLGIEDPRLVRVVGHKLRQEGALDLAVDQFEKALKMRPEEPQSYRDLALALAERARSRAKGVTEATAARAVWRDAERAIALLNDVAVKPWDGRFPDIEVVALEEANELVAWTQRLAGKPGFAGLELRNPIDARLRKLLDYDVRIVLSWDTDNSDMDLWVTEPTGEKCYYSNNLTEIGGAITRDFTQGYGPEAYAIRRAIAGKYVIQTNYYGTREQTLTGPTTLQAEVITRFGRPDESRRSLTLRLGQQSEVVDVGAIDFR
ncbi:MAG TPA: DUF2135 domain-containing protein, partial [Myxococcaceae bacterium]|nr:DUF2135 domain-containing protein [Myxococcaceae bacterium]